MATETLKIELDAEQLKSAMQDAIDKAKQEISLFDRLILEVRGHAALRAMDEMDASVKSARLLAGSHVWQPGYHADDRQKFIELRQQEAVDRLMRALYKIAAGDE